MMQEAQQHMDSGQFAEAEKIYRRLLERDPANTEAVYMLSVARQAQGDIPEATALMLKASEQEPENANVWHALGTLYMDQNEIDDARRAYLQALQCDPFHVDSHNGVAYTELVAGNFSAVERAANLALTEDPRNVQALVYLGTAKLEQDDTTKAVSYLQEALKEDPSHTSAQMQLGRAFLASDIPSFAMQCFQNVIRENAQSGIAWEYLGTAQYALGYLKESAESFRQALATGRSQPDTLKKLAEVELKLGNKDRAEEILQAANAQAELAGANTAIVQAELLIAKGNPAGALALLDKFEGPRYEGLIVVQARAHEQTRDFAAALDCLEPVISSGKASDEAQYSYARLLAKSGREQEADQMIGSLLAQEHPPMFARVFRGLQLCRAGEEEGIGMLQAAEQEQGLPDVDLRRIRKTLAETLDRAGRFEEAAGYYRLQEGRLAQVLSVAATSANANRTLLDSDEPLEKFAREDGEPLPADPVFLFAWPGSGWEWLAAGLGAHPDIMLVADKPLTQAARRSLISQPAGRAALQGLSASGAFNAASAYWNDLKKGGLEPGDRQTLDTMWVSADMLPTLSRLFPAARVLVVQRDPREMVLDWFRSGYSDLQDMAESYVDQLNALERFRPLLPLEFIEVNGEAMISDAGAELPKLAAELGLSWDESYSEKLAARAPAARENRGQWTDYQEILAAPLRSFTMH